MTLNQLQGVRKFSLQDPDTDAPERNHSLGVKAGGRVGEDVFRHTKVPARRQRDLRLGRTQAERIRRHLQPSVNDLFGLIIAPQRDVVVGEINEKIGVLGIE